MAKISKIAKLERKLGKLKQALELGLLLIKAAQS